VSTLKAGWRSHYRNRLREKWPTSWSLSPGRVKNDLFLTSSRPSGVHPASYPKGTEGSISRGKRPVLEANYSPVSVDDIKKTWIYTSTPQYDYMA
jgi:hypothetical protein